MGPFDFPKPCRPDSRSFCATRSRGGRHRQVDARSAMIRVGNEVLLVDQVAAHIGVDRKTILRRARMLRAKGLPLTFGGLTPNCR